MTLQMPAKLELPMPPGDPASLADLVQDVAGAAYWLTVLGERLTGPAAAAPGWIGDDAAAAAGQIGRVAVLTRDAGNAVLEATGRLRAHTECLREARRGVERLREEQDEDFRTAARRLWQMQNPSLAVLTESAEWISVIEEIEAAESARRRRHAALLEEVEDDAAATARVLAEACGVVGGTGARGDAGRVVAYLASELPGWGDQEMARRGRDAAHALTRGRPEDVEAAARAALTYAHSSAFADALLAELGVEGVRWLMTALGTFDWPHDMARDVPRLLATAFGSATSSRRAAAVVGALYEDRDDRTGERSPMVAGMAAVLAASSSLPSGGLPTTTVVAWSRQLLLWEHEHGTPAGMIPPGWGFEVHDPAALALEILAQRADPAAAAQLLGDVRIWETVLSRAWPDDGEALAGVITHAGQEPTAAGAQAVRHGLVVIGAGLVQGDPSDRSVNETTAGTVSFALGSGVAAHVDVVARSLVASSDGELPDYSRDVLRGLGVATHARPAAVLVGRALHSWIDVQPPVDEGVPPLVVAVPAAFAVAQNYGRRLPFVLDEERKQDDARDAAWVWDQTVGLGLQFVKKVLVVESIQRAENYVAGWLDVDGLWELGVDPGPVVSRDEVVDAAIVAMKPKDQDEILLVIDQACDSFDGALRVLGHPEAPRPPETD